MDLRGHSVALPDRAGNGRVFQASENPVAENLHRRTAARPGAHSWKRIAAVTFMSQEPAALRQWPQGAKVPVHYGTAEEILRFKPDLILTDPFISPLMRQLLTRTGARVVEVPPAENIRANPPDHPAGGQGAG